MKKSVALISALIGVALNVNSVDAKTTRITLF
jgi:hypothetical protein